MRAGVKGGGGVAQRGREEAGRLEGELRCCRKRLRGRRGMFEMCQRGFLLCD